MRCISIAGLLGGLLLVGGSASAEAQAIAGAPTFAPTGMASVRLVARGTGEEGRSAASAAAVESSRRSPFEVWVSRLLAGAASAPEPTAPGPLRAAHEVASTGVLLPTVPFFLERRHDPAAPPVAPVTFTMVRVGDRLVSIVARFDAGTFDGRRQPDLRTTRLEAF